jgi:hypothetical protein
MEIEGVAVTAREARVPARRAREQVAHYIDIYESDTIKPTDRDSMSNVYEWRSTMHRQMAGEKLKMRRWYTYCRR